jgi:hypothetical protein
MPKVSEVCRHVRSKAAGPFWVTVDLFFDSPENYRRYRDSSALGAEAFAALYGVEAKWVKRIPVDSLEMVKVSYPRATPQGWITERDLHSGQQYVRLLDLELETQGARTRE